eukprot:13195623-Alexandrium_andersonii.AAC.1
MAAGRRQCGGRRAPSRRELRARPAEEAAGNGPRRRAALLLGPGRQGRRRAPISVGGSWAPLPKPGGSGRPGGRGR